MQNYTDEEHNDSIHSICLSSLGDKSGNNDIKVEVFPLIQENLSLDGLNDKMDEDIKVKEEFPLLQESTNRKELCDKLDNNDVKVEEYPWWEDENTDDNLQVKEEMLTEDDTVQRKRQVDQNIIHTGERIRPYMSVVDALDILKQQRSVINRAVIDICDKCNIPKRSNTVHRLKRKLCKAVKQRKQADQHGKLDKWFYEAEYEDFCVDIPIENRPVEEHTVDVPTPKQQDPTQPRQPLTSELHRSTIERRVNAILPSFQSIAESENTSLIQLLLVVLLKVCRRLGWIKLAKLLYSVFIAMKDVDNPNEMSLEKSAYLMVSQELEKDLYQNLRSTLLSEGYEVQPWHKANYHCNAITPGCIPVIIGIGVGVIGYRYNFKDICKFIVNRSLSTTKLTGDTVPNKLYIGGIDGTDGSGHRAEVHVTVKGDILLYSFTPLLICAGDNADGEVLWQNPAPNSALTQRPVAVIGIKENALQPLIPDIELEITEVRMNGFHMQYMGKDIHVTVNSSITMFAGKMHVTLQEQSTGVGYCQMCRFSKANCHNIGYVINGYPVDRNIDMHSIFSMFSIDGELPVTAEPITQTELNTSISVAHTWVYCCSWFLNILYHLAANDNTWGFGTKTDARYRKLIQAKSKVQITFATVLDLNIDTADDTGHDNALMGNLAKRFFSEDCRRLISKLVKTSELNIVRTLHKNLQVILRIISSKDRKINIDKFRTLCTNTYVDIITHLKWVDLTLPVHKVLAHAPEIIEKNMCMGIGHLSKEGPEACQKIMKRFRAYWSWTIQLNDDVYLKALIRKMWLISDPVFFTYSNEIVTCLKCGSTTHHKKCPLKITNQSESDIIVEDMFID